MNAQVSNAAGAVVAERNNPENAGLRAFATRQGLWQGMAIGAGHRALGKDAQARHT